jgi:TetR/AcrR family transcriptional repressor of nem operon
MAGRTNRKQEILDATRELARQRGYHGFSIRDVAEAVGVRGAAIHYHFDGKAALGAAVTHQYTADFLDSLGDPTDEAALDRVVAGFRTALYETNAICLCGVLASEINALPQPVALETRAFFDALRTWVGVALETRGLPAARATAIVALLEGAMLVAKGTDDLADFDLAVTEASPLWR